MLPWETGFPRDKSGDSIRAFLVRYRAASPQSAASRKRAPVTWSLVVRAVVGTTRYLAAFPRCIGTHQTLAASKAARCDQKRRTDDARSTGRQKECRTDLNLAGRVAATLPAIALAAIRGTR